MKKPGHISDFLHRRTKHLYRRARLEAAIRAALQEIMGIELERRDFRIVDGKIFFKSHPVVHTEILIRQKEILKNIAGRLGTDEISQIL